MTLAIDRHPELVRRVIWVDTGPAASGTALAPDFPADAKDFPLPPFEQLAEQASLEGLNSEALDGFRSRAVAQPGPVLRQAVVLFNDKRFDVPTTLVCCSIPSSQIQELVGSGHPMFAEVANLINVDYIDLPTGHWPMWSRPVDLARTIGEAAEVV